MFKYGNSDMKCSNMKISHMNYIFHMELKHLKCNLHMKYAHEIKKITYEISIHK